MQRHLPAHRFAGTHYFAKIMSFEILPPLPTTSPTITSAPTISLRPTRNIGARLERWWGIGGTSISALTGNSRYPFSPDDTDILMSTLEAPTNIGDSYGQRLQTLIMPPVTCDWNFYIASDDNSVLYLSSNDDPSNKAQVASVGDWTNPKQWKKFGSQKGTISLVKGQKYYLEAVHKEGGGGDNLAIGWECVEHGIALGVIGAEYTELPIV